MSTRIGLDETQLHEASLKGDHRNADETFYPEASMDDKCASTTPVQADGEDSKKRTHCENSPNGNAQSNTVVKKAKRRPVNVWAKSSSRKGGKKSNRNGSQAHVKNGTPDNRAKEDCVYLTLASKHQEKIEDGPDLPVLLSTFHRAEKIELSEDRLSASSTKGYRMVRATRGVVDGAWYFEMLIEKLGQSGHTRLGWCTQKGEIQAPVGFDNHSYAYRDLDGSKVHMAVREPYAEPYLEGDVIGFYISLPNAAELAPKPPSLVSYRGQPYVLEETEDPLRIVPGSEIAFFRNGVFQGTAFRDINAGRYFPAASMYTLPNESKCAVNFNFGPEFRFPPTSLGDQPVPQPMSQAPHCGIGSLAVMGLMDWKSEVTAAEDASQILNPRAPQDMGEAIPFP